MQHRLPSLRRRRNLTWVSNVSEAEPRSLFWAPKGLNELPELRFEFPFVLICKLTMPFLKGQFTARTQILVRRRGPRKTISALFRRRSQPEFSFVCGVGQPFAGIFQMLVKWFEMIFVGKSLVFPFCIPFSTDGSLFGLFCCHNS